MATNFDPYKSWLGIPAGVRPPNHYQLLGLELFESEPPVIAEAAEERKVQLHALAVGAQAEIGRQLLEELAVARKVLLSAATRRTYDAELRQKLGMPAAAQPKAPAAPPARVVATPAATPVAAVPLAAVPLAAVPLAAQPIAGVPAAQPVVPMAAIPMAAVPMASSMVPVMAQAAMAQPAVAQAVPMAGMPSAVATGVPNLSLEDSSDSTYRPRYRRQTSAGSWALLAIGFLVLAGLGAVGFLYKDQLLAALEDRPQTTEVVVSGGSAPAVPVPHQPKTQAMDPVTAAARAGGMKNNAAQPGSGDVASMDLSSPNLANRGAPHDTPGRGMNSNPPMQNMDMNRQANREKPAPVKPKPVASQVVIPSLNHPASADEKAAVAKSLAAVRKALGERNNTKAAEQMNLAMLEASSPDSLAAIDRMTTLESALKAFWKAVDEGIKVLKPVDEVNYDGMTAVVINADPGSISLRVEGQSKEYKVNKLPTGLAYHLAERWLREGDPQTKIILGSFLYVDPKGDRQKARQLWESASFQGADVAKLLVQLDLDLATETGK